MCGICGVIGIERPELAEEITRRMTGALLHRGPDEDGFYVASVQQLRGCHTQAQSLDELIERVREAIALCLETEGGPVTELQFIGIQRITVAA